MMRPRLQILSSLCLCLPLFNCVATPKKPVEGVDKKAQAAAAAPDANLSEEEKKIFNEYRAETELGRMMAGRLLAFYGSHPDERLLAYLGRLGNYLASFGVAPDRRYLFAVLNSESVNAFACPGGYILITVGALRLAENEAELAGVIGHEVAHVGHQHMFKTLQSMDKEEMEKAAAEEAKRDVPNSIKARQRPKADDKNMFGDVVNYVSNVVGGGSFNLLKAAKAGMNVILEKGIDHKYEFEADREGERYAVRAGYDAKAFATYLARVEAKKGTDGKTAADVIAKTHPSITNRRSEIEKIRQEMGGDEIVGATVTKRFKKFYAYLPKEQKP